MSEATAVAKKPTNWAHEIWQLFLLVLAVLAVHSLVAKPFFIPSGSMLPSLLIGDRLIVSKFPYGYSYLSPSINILPEIPGRIFGRLPERGDVAVIKAPRDKVDYIKRVIGLPGDTVQMKNGQLWLNGAPVSRVRVADTEIPVSPNSDCVSPIDARFRTTNAAGEPVCKLPTYRETMPGGRSYLTLDLADTPQDNTDPMIVPEGHIFLMGDNRDNSEDSRFDPLIGGLGMLPIENLVGRAEFLTFSLDGSTSLNPTTWVSALRQGRFFKTIE
ncbi:signal peptidase I [Polymorphobacter fuscus]|uniref:Signal peptidase I n=1 Tax=Sandarakinorhabdus fusca TaxID=1439888 RepID=A0A7C9GQ00_9SPHN|nr:signal peptidase I [Polymorphobacter fuscus]KAB7647844.1 signal peptidase I [Polymorphobacter fuscus]MQT17150.1 signal peptidase I [Polymorphobacter fuscus]NJC08857.1 signal peptidase I [Polymorphobacter fuscus]